VPDLRKRGAVRSVFDGRYVFSRYFAPRNTTARPRSSRSTRTMTSNSTTARRTRMRWSTSPRSEAPRVICHGMNDKLNRLIDAEVGEDRGQMLPAASTPLGVTARLWRPELERDRQQPLDAARVESEAAQDCTHDVVAMTGRHGTVHDARHRFAHGADQQVTPASTVATRRLPLRMPPRCRGTAPSPRMACGCDCGRRRHTAPGLPEPLQPEPHANGETELGTVSCITRGIRPPSARLPSRSKPDEQFFRRLEVRIERAARDARAVMKSSMTARPGRVERTPGSPPQ